jgi:hypothetical protein
MTGGGVATPFNSVILDNSVIPVQAGIQSACVIPVQTGIQSPSSPTIFLDYRVKPDPMDMGQV